MIIPILGDLRCMITFDHPIETKPRENLVEPTLEELMHWGDEAGKRGNLEESLDYYYRVMDRARVQRDEKVCADVFLRCFLVSFRMEEIENFHLTIFPIVILNLPQQV